MWSSKVFHARNFFPLTPSPFRRSFKTVIFFACCLMKRIVETFTAVDDCYEINPIKSNLSERDSFFIRAVINKQDCAKKFFLLPFPYWSNIFAMSCNQKSCFANKKNFNSVYETSIFFWCIAISILRLSRMCQGWWWYVM